MRGRADGGLPTCSAPSGRRRPRPSGSSAETRPPSSCSIGSRPRWPLATWASPRPSGAPSSGSRPRPSGSGSRRAPGTLEFVVSTPPGAAGAYLLAPDGHLWLVQESLVQDLSAASSRLVDRRLHAFRSDEPDALQLQLDGRTRDFVVRKAQGSTRVAPAENPDAPSAEATAWADRVWRLAPIEVLGRGETPREGTPAVALRVEYSRARKPLGFLELGRAGNEWFARTEHTAGWVRLPAQAATLREQAERLEGGAPLRTVLRAEIGQRLQGNAVSDRPPASASVPDGLRGPSPVMLPGRPAGGCRQRFGQDQGRLAFRPGRLPFALLHRRPGGAFTPPAYVCPRGTASRRSDDWRTNDVGFSGGRGLSLRPRPDDARRRLGLRPRPRPLGPPPLGRVATRRLGRPGRRGRGVRADAGRCAGSSSASTPRPGRRR